ncbi:hypothetical protein SKAU_G00172560 [Synaphobranchus kaupii]|uniref:Uncharacterized protein n=1 Tax=Synaphobranchus kaupii TaxID=118154 RepID=A0A9Q1FKV5_SYNKA|nr:hypothetical protein SKAU_G00172560 [Synaphobranchus kaupii]
MGRPITIDVTIGDSHVYQCRLRRGGRRSNNERGNACQLHLYTVITEVNRTFSISITGSAMAEWWSQLGFCW